MHDFKLTIKMEEVEGKAKTYEDLYCKANKGLKKMANKS